MNSQFKIKFLNHINKKKNNKGFTLIELLVVVIIIGVLAAIALPNLLGQVAKGRQSEAKNGLGTINRAQQATRLEDSKFGKIGQLPVKIGEPDATDPEDITLLSGQYYIFEDGDGTANQVGMNQRATAKDGSGDENGDTNYSNDILDYASAVGQQDNGTFSAVVCEQTTNPSDTTAIDNGTVGTADAPADCPDTLKEIK